MNRKTETWAGIAVVAVIVCATLAIVDLAIIGQIGGIR